MSLVAIGLAIANALPNTLISFETDPNNNVVIGSVTICLLQVSAIQSTHGCGSSMEYSALAYRIFITQFPCFKLGWFVLDARTHYAPGALTFSSSELIDQFLEELNNLNITE